MPALLKHVDPSRPPSSFNRVYAALANTRLGRFIWIHLVWRVDPYLMRLTRGRLGMGLAMPTALLETRGAKSGAVQRQRRHLLPAGNRATIVASKLGLPSHQASFQQPPSASRCHTRRHAECRATVVGDEAERQRLWGLADRVFAPYAAYRREAAKAGRTIPIVRLSSSRIALGVSFRRDPGRERLSRAGVRNRRGHARERKLSLPPDFPALGQCPQPVILGPSTERRRLYHSSRRRGAGHSRPYRRSPPSRAGGCRYWGRS